MTIGTSLFLLAVGAILKYAVDDAVEGVDLSTVGVILMIVGVVGLIISLLWMMVLRDRAARTRYVERRDYVGREAPPPDAY